MKFDEYVALLTEMSNPDKVSENTVTLMDNIQRDLQMAEERLKEVEELTKAVENLRETNGKLILRITEPVVNPPEEEEKEKSPEENLQDLIQSIRGE